jgi:PhnB protein
VICRDKKPSTQIKIIFSMARVCTYLNFARQTEEAFRFYKTVFGTEFVGGGMMRFGDLPPQEGAPPLAEEDRMLVMHVSLPILGGHVLMGTDAPDSMGFSIHKGNQIHIQLEPDSKEDADRIFAALSEGGTVEMPMGDMFWGYFGSLSDRFGIQWMINVPSAPYAS